MGEIKKAKSREQTTEAQFNHIKMLQEAGIKDCEIMKLMNIGQTRLSCVKKFETYEEFLAGRKAQYDSYRKTPEERKHTKKKVQEEEPDKDQYKWVQELGLLRRQNELLQEQNAILKLISGKMAFLVEQLS